VKYGLYDSQDKCWMGNQYGPILYTDREMGCAAATVITERFKAKLGRYRCMEFKDKGLVARDEVTPPLSAEQAIKNICKGKVHL